MLKIRITIIIAFFIGLFISCGSDDTCRQNMYVAMRVRFYQQTTDSETGAVGTGTLTLDSLTVKGVGVDSVLINNQKKRSDVNVFLKRFKNETLYVFTFNDINDTLTILHQNEEELLSFECGYLTTYTLDTVYHTTHYIDSIAIKSRTVNATSNEENLSIYKYITAE
ncbi:MAG: hypothetical protein LBH80_02140 [Prevotellaceae bacterium]|jgi:hypothetical protein|nr:hypothetical protein [Prevotellaceae bacterium]